MKTATYDLERIGDERIMLCPASREPLGRVDAVVFDCDGVLIDVRGSYDVAILKTAETMVEGFSGVRLPITEIGDEIILRIRGTGGFNDDWETTYAISVFSVVALEGFRLDRRLTAGEVREAFSKLQGLIGDFSSRNRLDGRASVDEYLKDNDLESGRVEELRLYLDSPADAIHNRMTRAFDEVYYGGRLFRRIYGLEPFVQSRGGLIDRERLLITAKELNLLKRVLGGKRIAIASGRPHIAAKYTLGGLLRYFDEDASMFIGDGEIKPELLQELRKYRKPSGASLIRAQQKLSSKTLLYIGDSAEDRLMVEDARRTYDGVYFGGIYGTSFSQQEQARYFMRNGADMVMRTVGSTPEILRRLRE
jgi:phosphoglycolate phosphatase-like HAD superfamily hydrolase